MRSEAAFISLGDRRLETSTDPARSRLRLREAELDADGDLARCRIIGMLDEYGSALAERSTRVGHLTGSALVVDEPGQRVLVMLHAKLGRWLQPGGHADGDHELAGVALREATEETGIAALQVMTPAVDVDIHAIPARGDEPEHLHLDLRFVVRAPMGAEPIGNHESDAIRWVTIEQLRALADEPGLIRLAERGLSAYRQVVS
ncbi:MAG: NUDIX hydrolase [Microthrixaceae bacterium]